MILCKNNCIPHCDFCIYSIHEYFKMDDGKIIKGGPIGCQLNDWEEQMKNWPCDDFHCYGAENK